MKPYNFTCPELLSTHCEECSTVVLNLLNRVSFEDRVLGTGKESGEETEREGRVKSKTSETPRETEGKDPSLRVPLIFTSWLIKD